MLRLFPLVVGALALSRGPAPRGPAPRAAVHLSDLQTVKDAKARLVKGLLYNKRITDEGLALIEELAVRAPPIIAGSWWTGRFVMSSSYLVADALKGLGMWRLLDGAPVSVAVMGERVELETDLLVLGCGTGLRVRGSLQLQSLVDGTDAVRVTLDGSDFFEPTEEVKEPLFQCRALCLDLALTSPSARALRSSPGSQFGIAKALVKCEAELLPKLPSKDAPFTMLLRPTFVDEAILLLRETEIEPKERETPLTLVLSREP
jgi:hypothetical protein